MLSLVPSPLQWASVPMMSAACSTLMWVGSGCTKAMRDISPFCGSEDFFQATEWEYGWDQQQPRRSCLRQKSPSGWTKGLTASADNKGKPYLAGKVQAARQVPSAPGLCSRFRQNKIACGQSKYFASLVARTAAIVRPSQAYCQTWPRPLHWPYTSPGWKPLFLPPLDLLFTTCLTCFVYQDG